MCTPFAAAISSASTDKCDAWLSSNIKTGESGDGFTKRMKWRMKRTNSGCCIHPESFANPTVPSDTLSKKVACIFLRGNKKKGGTELPLAPTVRAIVTMVPRSAASTFPTRRKPFKAITLPILLGTVEKPVSSMLKMCWLSKW